MPGTIDTLIKMHTTNDTLRHGRALADARGALILIHGRGSSPEDIVGLIDVFNADDLASLAPAAAGGSWYPQRFFVPPEQNEPSLAHAHDAGQAHVDAHGHDHGDHEIREVRWMTIPLTVTAALSLLTVLARRTEI